MRTHGVHVDIVRAVDHDIATGVWPDMREHGAATDDWPDIFETVLAADILVLAGPIWLGDNSSVMKQVHERLYGGSHLLNDAGQYLYYGRVAGCFITGNEDGIKHCAMNVLYTLQHIGYTIPPQADAGWIGEAGPGPSYLDPGSGGPENDFTNRNTTFMTWNLMHLARLLKDAGGIPAYGNQRSEWDAGCRSTTRIRNTAYSKPARLSTSCAQRSAHGCPSPCGAGVLSRGGVMTDADLTCQQFANGRRLPRPDPRNRDMRWVGSPRRGRLSPPPTRAPQARGVAGIVAAHRHGMRAALRRGRVPART